mgnify:CR=1 FL=1
MLDRADKSQSDDIFRTSDRRSPAFVHKATEFSPPTRDIMPWTNTADLTSLRAPVSYDSSLTENLSPGAPVRAPWSDDTSPTVEGEVWITRGSPEDSRSVRRRLGEFNNIAKRFCMANSKRHFHSLSLKGFQSA